MRFRFKSLKYYFFKIEFSQTLDFIALRTTTQKNNKMEYLNLTGRIDPKRIDIVKEVKDDSTLDLFDLDFSSMLLLMDNISIKNNTSFDSECSEYINSRFQYSNCLALVENDRYHRRGQKVGKLFDANEPMV